MDGENTGIVEQEAVDLAAVESEIDADWDEAGGLDDSPTDQLDEGAEDAPEADQPKDDHETETEDKAEEKPPADQPETFSLKHMDEVKTVGRDEVIVLAQKGLDYDRIRASREELQAKVDMSAGAYALVEGYAKENGMTVPDYLDYCREQALVGQGISAENAKVQIALEKERERVQAEGQKLQDTRAQQEAAQREAQERETARQKSFAEFFAAYPDVKPDAVPKEVWAKVAEGVPLMTAYTRHENERLKAELAAERQNKANADKTTGSQTTGGEKNVDPYDEGWDD